jgi:hypothetical protein
LLEALAHQSGNVMQQEAKICVEIVQLPVPKHA